METLTAIQKGVKVTVSRQEFLKAWNDNRRVVDLIAEFGVSETTIKLWRRWNILPKRSVGAWRSGAVDDPTPFEIEQRAAEIRQGWTPEEEERRRVGYMADSWAAKEYLVRRVRGTRVVRLVG